MSSTPFAIDGKPVSIEDSILTAFDAGSVSILDLVAETIGKLTDDEFFTLVHDFRNEVVAKMNERIPGSGDAIAVLADQDLGDRLDGVDWDV
jgi:hypothetical protein